MRKFFGITQSYQFECMDISTFFTFLTTCIILTGRCTAPLAIPVNVIGLVWDLCDKPHVNQVFMRLSLIVMNIYFLIA